MNLPYIAFYQQSSVSQIKNKQSDIWLFHSDPHLSWNTYPNLLADSEFGLTDLLGGRVVTFS